jgi:beta-lactamase regulating signal transducer with metallopeptidase domain
MIQALLNHLWQSTLVVMVVGIWAWLLREHNAALRYWLWFSAAVKFLVPFSLLIVLGTYFAPRVSVTTMVAPVLGRIVAPAPPEFEIVPPSTAAPAAASTVSGPSTAANARGAQLLFGLWAGGAGFVLGRWVLRSWRLRQTVEESVPLSIAAPIPVRAAPTAMEPGVVGVIRPVMVLPHAIEEHLNADELHAVLLHELEHVRRADNLTAGICMLMQALFWFYPLVWWLGRRLMVEREVACDQAVIAAGCDRETYAQAILNVCKLYVESPLACAAGVAGADLRRRIESIMTHGPRRVLSAASAALLSLTATVTLLLPVVLGAALGATPNVAQAQEVAIDVPASTPGDAGTVVTAAPYSGVATQQITREFTDGNRMTRTVRITRYYRDTAGRTRVERNISRQSAGASAELQIVLVEIYDPIKGERYLLSPQNKTAELQMDRAASHLVRPPLTPPGIIAYWGGLVIGPNEHGWSEPESLGEQVMEGVRVVGTRRVYTLAAGAVGNEKQIGMTIEQWFSPELGVIVSKTNQATTGGGASYRLDHIVQGEPDPGLFVLPADYTLHRGSVASD